MVIKLAFAYFPVRDEHGRHGGDFEISRLDNTSVDSVHAGCEGCAEFVAGRVVEAAKAAVAEYKTQGSKGKWCAHCKTDCPEHKPDAADAEKRRASDERYMAEVEKTITGLETLERLKQAVESGDKLLQRVHDLLGVVVRDSRADDEMCIEMSDFADEVWEHLHRDDKRVPENESGAVK